MKTRLSLPAIAEFLATQVGDVDDIAPMVEGEESQAFSFRRANEAYVIRIGPSAAGYRKDAFASRVFGDSLPIPEVLQVGQIDADHAFAISRLAAGITLQDASESVVIALQPQLTDLWRTMQSLPVGAGYGPFDEHGHAPFPSWQAYVLSVADQLWHEWTLPDPDLVQRMIAELRRLAPLCPAEHSVVHADFGSNNVLVDPATPVITAVIDWESALYGDPLFDIATAYFWRTWLMCMEQSAQYWDEHLAHLPRYRERIRCYQLVIGLAELADNARDGDRDMLMWLSDRCVQILADF